MRYLHFSVSIFFVISFPLNVHAQNIATYAGNGGAISSGDGGAATAAASTCFQVVIDAPGNLYITDRQNHRIRMVNTAGIITTVAGNGMAGYSGDGVQATATELNYPNGVAVDTSGNLFIIDGPNNRLRKVSSSGIISTIAGNGLPGYTGDGGPATNAEISDPYGVATDASGNIYIADSYNNCIRKINTSGIINTIIGTGNAGYSGDGAVATMAQVNFPMSVIVDETGNIFFSDTYNNRVRMVNTSGVISTIAGSGPLGSTAGSFGGDGGPATASLLNYPLGLYKDAAGDIFIADYQNSCVRKVNTSGIITTVAGTGTAGYSGDGGPATAATLYLSGGVAMDAAGYFYIADWGNGRVRRFNEMSSTVVNNAINMISAINIYPNPTSSGIFSVNVSSEKDEQVTMIITNLTGDRIWEINTVTNKTINIGLERIPDGLYFINAATAEENWSKKIVVKK